MKRRHRKSNVASLSVALCAPFAPLAALAAAPFDLSSLGSVAVAGDFDSIQRVSSAGQLQSTASQFDSILALNTSSQLVSQLNQTDGFISDSCTLDNAIFFTGNFSTVGSLTVKSSPPIVSYNVSTSEIANVLDAGTLTNSSSGAVSVNKLYCDAAANQLYVAGDFVFNSSAGVAVYDVSSQAWSSPLFGGFKNSSVVNTITKFNDNLIFGGKFSDLANSNFTANITTTMNHSNSSLNISETTLEAEKIIDMHQQISFSAATWQTEGSNTSSADVSSLSCPDGSNTNWKLTDDRQGTLTVSWPFYYSPSRVRLYNLHDSDDGTKYFRFTAFPLNGILNLTYYDEASSTWSNCDAWCPLPSGRNASYMDYQMVNVVGLNSFQLLLLDHYGSAAGLSGIQIFQNQLIAFANQSLNQPLSCEGFSDGAKSTTSGSWVGGTFENTIEMSSNLTTADQVSSTFMELSPNITIPGNYSVQVYTPGCLVDNTCAYRGNSNVTFYYNSTETPISTTVSQTNYYDKYDVIYSGPVESISSGFRPYVEIRASTRDINLPQNLVTQQISFSLLNSTYNGTFWSNATNSTSYNLTNSTMTASKVALNGLFEFDQQNFTDYLNGKLNGHLPVGNTSVNALLSNSDNAFTVNGLATANSTLFVGGDFRINAGDHLVALTNSSTKSLSPGGVVSDIYTIQSGELVAVGSFPGKAVRVSSSPSISQFGGGFDEQDSIRSVSSFFINGTEAIAFSGTFDFVRDAANVSSIRVSDSAIWIPSQNAWLQKSNFSGLALAANISASANLDSKQYYFGSVWEGGNSASGASLITDDSFDLKSLPFNFSTFSGSSTNGSMNLTKRASPIAPENSINAGAFANTSLMILGGDFSVTSDNNNTFHSLLFVDSSSGAYSGIPALDSSANVMSLLVENERLYVGGDFQITQDSLRNLFFYELSNKSFSNIQPPGLDGEVLAIRKQPHTDVLVVAGNFENAGSFSCPTVCLYDLSEQRWNSPPSGLGGSVASMEFIGSNVLLLAGNMTLNGTSAYLATYDLGSQVFNSYPNVNKGLNGPVNSFALNGNLLESIFATGTNSTNGGSYLQYWNNEKWVSLDSTFGSSTNLTGVNLLSLSKSTSSGVLPSDQILLVTGNIELANTGNASAVTYDGSNWQALLSTSKNNGATPGKINQLFSQSTESFSILKGATFLRRGYVVLIALAISLGIMLILIGGGALVTWYRRKKDGYHDANRVSESEMQETVPPTELFDEMRKR